MARDDVDNFTLLLDKIIYSVSALIIVINEEGRIFKFNRKCEEITGLKEKDVQGKLIWDFFLKNQTERSRLDDVLEIILNSILSSSFMSTITTIDDKKIDILWNNTIIKDDDTGKLKWTIGTGIDITDRVEAEREVKKLNEELELKVIERTSQLEEANLELHNTLETLKAAQDELIKVEKMAALGNLVAGVAHEINNPVGITVTAASHFRQKTEEISAKFDSNTMKKSDFIKYLKIAHESSSLMLTNLNRASQLVQSFKQVAVDRTTELKRKFQIKAYIDEVLLSLKPKLKKTQHKVINRCDPAMEIDSYPGLFSQIITNFIMNSLMHGFAGKKEGTITIGSYYEEGRPVVTYNDDGKGIREEYINKIFDPFFTTRRGAGGTGIGLHIVFNIVTAKFGGQIECKSREGEGCTFYVRFPGES